MAQAQRTSEEEVEVLEENLDIHETVINHALLLDMVDMVTAKTILISRTFACNFQRLTLILALHMAQKAAMAVTMASRRIRGKIGSLFAFILHPFLKLLSLLSLSYFFLLWPGCNSMSAS